MSYVEMSDLFWNFAENDFNLLGRPFPGQFFDMVQ